MPSKQRKQNRGRQHGDSDDDLDPFGLLAGELEPEPLTYKQRKNAAKKSVGGPSPASPLQSLAPAVPSPDVETDCTTLGTTCPDDSADVTVTTFVVGPSDGGQRIDQILALRLPGSLTRSRVKRGLKDGGVLVNGQIVQKQAFKVKVGDAVCFRDAQREAPGFVSAEPIPLQIYYEDQHCIVLEKPAGMVVHPAKGIRSGTLVNALLHHVGCSEMEVQEGDEQGDEDGLGDGDPCLSVSETDTVGFGTSTAEPESVMRSDEKFGCGRYPEPLIVVPETVTHQEQATVNKEVGHRLSGMTTMDQSDYIVRPGIVHRLDRGTSGVMVVAKHDAAHSLLSVQFAERTSQRTYLAILWGVPSPTQGRVDAPVGRDPGDRLRMTVVPTGKGKRAVTNYEVVEVFDNQNTSLVRFKLETGRTHQIRVHARHIGHPLLGDSTYGGAHLVRGQPTIQRKCMYEDLLQTLQRPALHARTLGFKHPLSSEWLSYQSELPRDFVSTLETLRQGCS